MAISKERRGEIAEAVLRYIMVETGFELNANATRRKLGNIAKATQISLRELAEFFRPMIEELVAEIFSGDPIDIK